MNWRYPPPSVGALVLALLLLGIGYLIAPDLGSFMLGAAVSTALVYGWYVSVSKHRSRLRASGKAKP